MNGKKVHGTYEVRLFEYLSNKFDFTPQFVYDTSGNFNPKNNSWSGIFGKVVQITDTDNDMSNF